MIFLIIYTTALMKGDKNKKETKTC